MRIFIAIIFYATCVCSRFLDGNDPETILRNLLATMDDSLHIDTQTRGFLGNYFAYYFNASDTAIGNALDNGLPSKVLVILSIDIDDQHQTLNKWVVYNDRNWATPNAKDELKFQMQPPQMITVQSEEVRRKFSILIASSFYHEYFVLEGDMDTDDGMDPHMKKLKKQFFEARQSFEKAVVESRLVYEGVSEEHPHGIRTHAFVAIALEY